MAVYGRPEALYTVLRPLFDRLQAEVPGCFQGLLSARLSLRLKTLQPVTELLLDGQRPALRVSYGTQAVRAGLEVELTADDLHRLLLAELSMKKAMASRLIRVRGPAWKLSVLIPIIQAGRQVYPELAGVKA